MVGSKLRFPMASACIALGVACAGTREDPLTARLVGGWRFAKVCQYEIPGVEPCSPIATPIEWLRFEEGGTATENTPNGASGPYRIERRELPGGGTEALLSVGGRNMGRVSLVGDTLVLGMAYVDGADRYFVRMREMGR